MAKLKKKLQCFDVNITSEKLTSELDIFTEVVEALKEKTVEERYRRLNTMDEDGAGDFIANYKVINNKILMVCFISLKKGIAIEVKKAFFSKLSFALSELENKEKKEVEGHIKDYTHFLLTKDFLILKNTQGIKADEIATYLNWLLKKESSYEDNPMIFTLPEHLKSEIDISDIASFALGNDVKINKDNIIEKSLTTTKEMLTNILSSSKLDIDLNNVFDAYITFKLKKVSKEDITKKKKVIQAFFQNLKDENLKIYDKHGKIIDVNKIKATKEVSITYTNTGFPDETELETEMIAYFTGDKK